MSRFHTNTRDRASKKYAALHRQLTAEISASKPKPDTRDKQTRHRVAAQAFRCTGER